MVVTKQSRRAVNGHGHGQIGTIICVGTHSIPTRWLFDRCQQAKACFLHSNRLPLLHRILIRSFLSRMSVRAGASPRRSTFKDDRNGRDTYPLRDSSLLPSSFLKSSRPEHSRMWRYLSRRNQRLLLTLLSLACLVAIYLLCSSGHSPKEIIREVPSQTTNVRLGGAKPHAAVGHPHAAGRPTVTLTHTQIVIVTETAVATTTVIKEITVPAEPVIFVLIMISADSASEGAILLKVCVTHSHRNSMH